MTPPGTQRTASPVGRRAAATDTAFVLGCAVVYVAAANLAVGGALLIAAVSAVFLTYAVTVLPRRREAPRDYGLRRDNLRAAACDAGIWTAAGAVLILLWAFWQGRRFPAGLLVLLPLYPAWGILQQLIFQGLLHRRLQQLVGRPRLAAVLTALAFALVHLGSWPLVGLTFAAGLVWSFLFRRHPNVWVLGLSHGILAALAYPLLLADDPLARM